jgi:hypothetical protein
MIFLVSNVSAAVFTKLDRPPLPMWTATPYSVQIKRDCFLPISTVNATLKSTTPYEPLEYALWIEHKLVKIASVVLELRQL